MLFLLLSAVCIIPGWAQQDGLSDEVRGTRYGEGVPEAGTVEVFTGATLRYGDTNFKRLYNVLFSLTPGVKWHLGHDWMVSGQLTVPIVNDGYQNKDDVVRLTNATVAKQLHFGNQHFKVTGGLFGYDRYGLDVRWMYPVTSWLLVRAQAGYTGAYRLAASEAGDWEYFGKVSENDPRSIYDYYHVAKTADFHGLDVLTAIGGVNVWLAPWDTEFRLSGGRYLNEDYGVEGEVMRHFRNCTVSLYAQLHKRQQSGVADYVTREAGGFRVVMLLPQNKLKSGKFSARLASNFRLTYNAQADSYSMRNYTTDPEENERHYPVRVAWGTGLLAK